MKAYVEESEHNLKVNQVSIYRKNMGGPEFLSCTVQFFSLGGHAVGLGILLIFFFCKYLAQLLEPKQKPRKCHSLYKLKGKVRSIPIAAKYHSVCSYCN